MWSIEVTGQRERERERERRKKPNFFPEENNPLTLHQLLVDQA